PEETDGSAAESAAEEAGEETDPAEAGEAPSEFPFTDIPADSPLVPVVDYVYRNGIIRGMDDVTFAPAGELTRAMAVTILFRGVETLPRDFDYDEPPEDYEMPKAKEFSDVPADAWYAEPVAWASMYGVVNGVSDTEFDPDGVLTLEQMCAIIYRYGSEYGFIRDVSAGLPEDYEYAESVSDWAFEPLCYAADMGLIAGGGASYLDPKGAAARAQMAFMIYSLFGVPFGEEEIAVDWSAVLPDVPKEAAEDPEAVQEPEQTAPETPVNEAGIIGEGAESVFTASKNAYSYSGAAEWNGVVVDQGAVVTMDGVIIDKPSGEQPIIRVKSDSAASVSGGELNSSVAGTPVIAADGSGAKIGLKDVSVWSGGADADCLAVSGGSAAVSGGSLTSNDVGSFAVSIDGGIVSLTDCAAAEAKNFSAASVKNGTLSLDNSDLVSHIGAAASIVNGTLNASGSYISGGAGDPLFIAENGADISLTGNKIEGGSSLLLISGGNGFRANLSLSGQTVAGDVVIGGAGSGWGRVDMAVYAGSDWTGAVQSGRWGTNVNVSLYGSSKWRVTGASYINSLHVDALSNLFARGREVEIHTHSFTVGRTSIYSEVKYGSVRIIVD
ncbi:MAG: S-layer homology domain-containing protein, partial [Clostridiales bacterium]|nr:S-layer homology domain-containing protein [Clostridiales bacterium]